MVDSAGSTALVAAMRRNRRRGSFMLAPCVVARLERSVIGFLAKRRAHPGFRLAPSGLRSPISIRLCPGEFDPLRPLRGLVGDEWAECGGGAGQRYRAEIRKPRLDLGVGEAGIDLSVEPLD